MRSESKFGSSNHSGASRLENRSSGISKLGGVSSGISGGIGSKMGITQSSLGMMSMMRGTTDMRISSLAAGIDNPVELQGKVQIIIDQQAKKLQRAH